MESVNPPVVDPLNGKEPLLRFQTGMSEKRQNAWILHPGGMEETVFAAPLEPPVSRSMERQYCQNGNGVLRYLGIVEPVGLICTCYLSDRDLSTIHVMNPLGKGVMNQLYGHIREALKGEGAAQNEELARHIEDMEAGRREALETADNYTESQNVMKQNLQTQYPGIQGYKDVWEHMATLEARCAAYEEAVNRGADRQEAESIAKECSVAFYDAMEDIFAISLNKNYPRDKIELVDARMTPLTGNRNYASYYLGIAEQAGFEDLESCRRFFGGQDGKIKNGILKSVMYGARMGKMVQRSLPELVVAHMFQAAVEEAHPFREAARRCPEILPLVKTSKKTRDIFKHGLDERNVERREDVEVPSGGEITQMRVLTETLLEVLLVPRATEAEQKQQAAAYDNRRAASIRAKDKMEEYPALKTLVGRAAEKACFSFYYQDPEYFSACLNLMMEMYDVLFTEYSTQGQRETAAEAFTGGREEDDAFMHQCFQRYACDYKSPDRPNTRNIRQFSYNVKDLSVKCKLYLSFVLLDRENPEFLRCLVEEAPGFPQVTDEVCRKRGHNNQAFFGESPDGYEAFQQELMGTCERFCQVLRKGRTRQ